ncbi:hypothetical protein [Azospirillum argentinense]
MEIPFFRTASGKMADPVATQAFRQLVRSTMDTPGDERGLLELAQRPGRALAAIRQELVEDTAHQNLDLKWLSTIYKTLRDAAAEASGFTDASEPLPRLIHKQTEALGENAQIGVAFRSVFVPGTPADLLSIEYHFSKAERVTGSIREMLLRHPSVIYGGEVATRLVPYGLTPALILGASGSIGNSLRRYMRMNKSERDAQVPLPKLVQALQYVTQMPEANTCCLFDWIIQLGTRCKPHIIPGYELSRNEQGLNFRLLEERRKDAEFIWKSGHPGDSRGLS